jgi:hypothetical protein
VNGASWVQKQVLEKHPDAKLRVYAIWQPILLTDFRLAWRESRLPDPRVMHLWDINKAAGHWFSEYSDLRSEDGAREIAWDLFYLFGPEARWDSRLDPPEAWDGPVVYTGERLLRAIESRPGTGPAASEGERRERP